MFCEIWFKKWFWQTGILVHKNTWTYQHEEVIGQMASLINYLKIVHHFWVALYHSFTLVTSHQLVTACSPIFLLTGLLECLALALALFVGRSTSWQWSLKEHISSMSGPDMNYRVTPRVCRVTFIVCAVQQWQLIWVYL